MKQFVVSEDPGHLNFEMSAALETDGSVPTWHCRAHLIREPEGAERTAVFYWKMCFVF